jgi:hypothetical protein
MSTYHKSIIELISFILRKGNEYLIDIDSGNAYDKILRNYHQINFRGEKVYRNISLMQTNYRFTKEAWKNKGDLKELYFEHLIPIRIIKDDLRNIIGTDFTDDDIRSILDKTEIVVITRNQAKQLDMKFKSSLPDNGINRLQSMNYEVEEQTENNSIFELNK